MLFVVKVTDVKLDSNRGRGDSWAKSAKYVENILLVKQREWLIKTWQSEADMWK